MEPEEFWNMTPPDDPNCVHPMWRRKWTYPPDDVGPIVALQCTLCGGAWLLALCQRAYKNGSGCGMTVRAGEEFCRTHAPTVEETS